MIQSSIGERPEELRAELADQAHLWISGLDSWRQTPILTPEEEDRARTLRHPGAQASFVAGRSLVRFVLSHYADVEPHAWSFSSSREGRPEIEGPVTATRLRFNLSHTDGLAACVVTAEADCGIDVERLERPLKPLRIAEHSFAAEEFDDLATRPEEELRERFFSYWTLKESYYKALGSGIPFRMTGARFELLSPGSVAFRPSEDEGVDSADWQFGLYRPTSEHLLAAAVGVAGRPAFEVRTFSSLAEADPRRFEAVGIEVLRSTPAEIAV